MIRIKNEIKKLSNYDLMIDLRMKSLREYRSIEFILNDEDFFLSIDYRKYLMNRMIYLKIQYNL